jgi:hypothetical protein
MKKMICHTNSYKNFGHRKSHIHIPHHKCTSLFINSHQISIPFSLHSLSLGLPAPLNACLSLSLSHYVSVSLVVSNISLSLSFFFSLSLSPRIHSPVLSSVLSAALFSLLSLSLARVFPLSHLRVPPPLKVSSLWQGSPPTLPALFISLLTYSPVSLSRAVKSLTKATWLWPLGLWRRPTLFPLRDGSRPPLSSSWFCWMLMSWD